MMLNPYTGLWEGQNKYFRIQLMENYWCFFDISKEYKKFWYQQPELIPFYKIHHSQAKSAKEALAKMEEACKK